MKLFLASLILASVSLAETSCDPVRLYRKDAKKLTYPGSDDVNIILEIPGDLPNSVIRVDPKDGFLDRFDTANINEGNATHNFNRQIATICTNQAPGTVPLYRGFSFKKGLHMSHINLEKLASAGYTRERSLGYVYATLPAQENTGFFQVYSIKIKGTEYMTSEIHDEGNHISGTTKETLFFSMPLEPKLPTTTKPKLPTTTKPTTTKPTTTKPNTTRVTLATSACNPFQANFSECSFTSNCPSGRRCLAPMPPKEGTSGVAAISTTMKFSTGFMKGQIKEAFGALKSGWDIVATAATHPTMTLRFWWAASRPAETLSELAILVVKNCLVEGPGKASFEKLKSCISNHTQQIANEIQQSAQKTHQYCFQTDAETLGECTGRGVFEVALVFSGIDEIRAVGGLEELRVTLLTNDLAEEEIAASKSMLEKLKCPLLRKRAEGLPCLSQSPVVDRIVVKAEEYPVFKTKITSNDQVVTLLSKRVSYMTNSYRNNLYLKTKTLASEFEDAITAAKAGTMRAFGDALAPKISAATRNMEEELRNIFKIYTISEQEMAEHQWISSSNSRINAYMHLLSDNDVLISKRPMTNERMLEIMRTNQYLMEAFKTDYSISNEAAALYLEYADSSSAAANQEALFTSGLAKIPNYEGYMVRYSELHKTTESALQSAFSNQVTIDLSTIVEGGNTDYILAGAPGGEPSTFDYYENVIIVKSKTGKYISPVASETEPEIVIVGSAKKFLVKNIIEVQDLKNIYILEETV